MEEGAKAAGTYLLSRSETGRQILIGEAVVAAVMLGGYYSGLFEMIPQPYMVASADMTFEAAPPTQMGIEIALETLWEGIKVAAPYAGPGGATYVIASTATFDRGDSNITIHTDRPPLQPVIQFPAGNSTTNPRGYPYTPESHGPAPNGTFPVGNFISTGNDPNSALGVSFVPINLPVAPPLLVPRTGVGLHSGRANRGGPRARTHGCIRTTDDAMRVLEFDPLTTITIQE